MNEIPYAQSKPPLTYDKECNREKCGQPATHRIAVICGKAHVHFGLVVCISHAPEITIDDVVPKAIWNKFESLVRVQHEYEAQWKDCKVHVTPL